MKNSYNLGAAPHADQIVVCKKLKPRIRNVMPPAVIAVSAGVILVLDYLFKPDQKSIIRIFLWDFDFLGVDFWMFFNGFWIFRKFWFFGFWQNLGFWKFWKTIILNFCKLMNFDAIWWNLIFQKRFLKL